MKNNSIKNGIIIVVLLILFPLIYFVIKEFTEDDSLGYSNYLKNYGVNEYIAT